MVPSFLKLRHGSNKNMAGIYIHVPFCQSRCIYCDFYSTTRSDWKERYVRALCGELQARQGYLRGEAVKTVYLGGGTPSQLSAEELKQVLDTIEALFGRDDAREITLEANPDDLTEEYVARLRTLPVNRLSMGIQTFHDPTLRLLNRRHTALQAVEAVERCRRAGFRNLSIDLIYGLPGETEAQWQADLHRAVDLGVEHISAYHLTYEEGTQLYRLRQAGRISEVDEESSIRFFHLLMEELASAGYIHYEISNFCKPGFHSRHNSSYWEGIPYLGCGPSAHSFDRESREWNTASLETYLTAQEAGRRVYEREVLDGPTRYDEYVMTSLRTRRGASAEEVGRCFGEEFRHHFLRMAAPHLAGGRLEMREGRICLTREGIFVSDGIICDLMWG